MANYTRKLKQALEKIEQNAKFIEQERSKLTLSLTDIKQIEGWEAQIKVKGTPLTAYYETWNKVRTVKKNKEITKNDVLGDYNLPTMKKHKISEKKNEGPVELFPSDSEDEEMGIEKKPRRGKRGGKNVAKKYAAAKQSDVEEMDVNDAGDLVKDISADDW